MSFYVFYILILTLSIYISMQFALPVGNLWLKTRRPGRSLLDLTNYEKQQMFPGFEYLKDGNYMIVSTKKDKLEYVAQQGHTMEMIGDFQNFTFQLKNTDSVPFSKHLNKSYHKLLSSMAHCLYNGEAFINNTELFDESFTTLHGLVIVNLCKLRNIHGEIMGSDGTWKFSALPLRFQNQKTIIKLVVVYIDNSKEWFNTFPTKCGFSGRVKALNDSEGQEWKQMETETISRGLRTSRQSKPHVIQLSMFVDIDLYQAFGGSEARLIDDVLLHLNSVQLIMSHQGLIPQISLSLSDIVVLSSPDLSSGLLDTNDAEEYLKTFGSFQAIANPSDTRSERHWDHGILLTGKNLIDATAGTAVLGIAYLEGMCDPVQSVSVVEGNHPLVATIIAHEIGHSVGSVHDGSNNSCSGGVMSAVLGPDQRQYRWSKCSSDMIGRFLSFDSRSKCLLEP